MKRPFLSSLSLLLKASYRSCATSSWLRDRRVKKEVCDVLLWREKGGLPACMSRGTWGEGARAGNEQPMNLKSIFVSFGRSDFSSWTADTFTSRKMEKMKILIFFFFFLISYWYCDVRERHRKNLNTNQFVNDSLCMASFLPKQK